MSRAAFELAVTVVAAAVLCLVWLASNQPAYVTRPATPVVGAPQLPAWTPPFWHPSPTAERTHRSVCFSPDFAPVNRIECWAIDANSDPYGPYYVPAVA